MKDDAVDSIAEAWCGGVILRALFVRQLQCRVGPNGIELVGGNVGKA